MPPPKSRPSIQQDDARSESSAARERLGGPSGTGRKGKGPSAAVTSNSTLRDGSGLKEVALANAEASENAMPGQNSGVSWNTLPAEVLDGYRLANSMTSPAAFKSSHNQLVLAHSSLARHSPTMARRKDKRRVSKDHLATAVRKHFNGAAVSELDVVVELAYKSKTKGKAFRLRSGPLNVKR